MSKADQCIFITGCTRAQYVLLETSHSSKVGHNPKVARLVTLNLQNLAQTVHGEVMPVISSEMKPKGVFHTQLLVGHI